MKTMRLKSDAIAWVIGAQKRIRVPKDALIDMDEATSGIGVLKHPSDLEGLNIRVTSDMAEALADVDAETTKAQYAESLKRCLNTVANDFDILNRIDSGTPLRELRDLGPLSDWVQDPKLLRSWIHHINMKIEHPSLSVEKAMFPDNEMHLVLVLTQTW